MDYYENIIEYYDELFPVCKETLNFITSLEPQIRSRTGHKGMIRVLDVECATGVLDQLLVAENFDVTGFDSSPAMLESCIRRKKLPYTNSRFLEMSILDMSRYLCKNSFQVILCLENKIAALDDVTLLRKFFFDAREILVSNGYLILDFINFDQMRKKQDYHLQDRVSPRVKFCQQLTIAEEGLFELTGRLDFGTPSRFQEPSCMMQYPIKKSELESMAKAAGFNDITYFSDYAKTPLTTESPRIIALLTANVSQ